MHEQVAHILLVEDEKAHVELLYRAFEAHGERFHLTFASSLADARACLAESLPDLIIADLHLPDGLGTELLPAEGDERTVPLIVMTAHGHETAAVEAMKAGALDYLVKSEEVMADIPRTAERALRAWRDITGRRVAEQALRRFSQENAVMAEIGRIVNSSLDIEEVYQQIGNEFGKLIDFDRLAINVIDQENGIATHTYIAGIDIPELPLGRTFPLSDSSSGLVVSTKATQLIQPQHEQELAELFPRMVPAYRAGLKSFMLVPLISQGEVVATLRLQSFETNAYCDDDVRVAELIGAQIAGAIANARLYTDLKRAEESGRRRRHELEVRYNLARILSEPSSLEAKLKEVLQELIRATESEWATFRLLDEKNDGLRLVSTAGISEWDRPLIQPVRGGIALSIMAVQQGAISVANDYPSHPSAEPSAIAQGARSMMSAPIVTGSQTVGAVTVVSTIPNHYTDERVELLPAVTEWLGVLLERAKLIEERQAAEEAERERSGELAALYEISRIVSLPGAFADKAKSVLNILTDLSGAEWATFRVSRDDEPGLFLLAAGGPDVETSPPIPVFTEEQPIAMSALRDGKLRVVNDYAAEPNPSQAVLAMGTRSFVMIPLTTDGQPRGLVNVVSRKPHHFTPEIVRLLTAVGEGLGVHLEKARMDEEQQRADEQIKASLEEKEVLLKEINHRVKNNLQIISSLLSLQSRDIQDERTLRSFRVSQDRIQAMALVHEKLYQSDDLSRIEFGEYIKNLADDLRNSYGLRSQNVTLKIDVEDTWLGVDTAIPCGVIVNELVSNSLKHAFPGDRSGEIVISFREVDGQYRMVFKDDGVGIPEDLDISSSPSSLGLTIVNALTGQLGGAIDIGRNGGTEISITFPAKRPKGD